MLAQADTVEDERSREAQQNSQATEIFATVGTDLSVYFDSLQPSYQ